MFVLAQEDPPRERAVIQGSASSAEEEMDIPELTNEGK